MRSRACSFLLLSIGGCGSSPTGGMPDAAMAPPDLATRAIPTGTELPTKQGSVSGKTIGRTRAFLGLPYAAPPTGPNRWRAPQPPMTWMGARDAKALGASCPQGNFLTGAFDENAREDCLTLNVWTPEPAPSKALPVMVWIHGGAYILGSGGEPTYDGQKLSEAAGVVVVTLNYRLGILGWLAHPALTAEGARATSGNYGHEDQRAALEWVRDNIAAFGGDAGNVTIFGESAGGSSVCSHLVSPASHGLFHKAIVESGPCWSPMPTLKEAEATGMMVQKTVGCADVACLRAKTPRELLTAVKSSGDLLLGDGVRWWPVVDGAANFPKQMSAAFKEGAAAKVPVIIGSTANEGSLFVALTNVSSEADYKAAVARLMGAAAQQVVAQYPAASYKSAKEALSDAIGDGIFVCPARKVARALGGRTFLYHFTRPGKFIPLGDLGAAHSYEIPYVFGNPYIGTGLTPDEMPLMVAMQRYWGSFAAGGVPSGTPEWPEYKTASDEHLTLDLTITKGSGLKKAKCDFWDGLLQ